MLMPDLFTGSVAISGRMKVVGLDSLLPAWVAFNDGSVCEKPALWLRCVWIMVW